MTATPTVRHQPSLGCQVSQPSVLAAAAFAFGWLLFLDSLPKLCSNILLPIPARRGTREKEGKKINEQASRERERKEEKKNFGSMKIKETQRDPSLRQDREKTKKTERYGS